MNISLSWDLFIVSFFVVIVAYSFIVGKSQVLKIILGSYLAVLAADGMGNLFQKYIGSSSMFLKMMSLFGVGSMDQAELYLKIFIFIGIIVIMAIRGGFHVHAGENVSGIVGMILLLIFGFLSASLILSTLMIYISGASLIKIETGVSNAAIYDIYNSSRFARILMDYYSVWFSLPAIAFLITSLFTTGNAPAIEGEY